MRLREAIQLDDISLVKRLLTNRPDLLQNPNFEDKSNTSLHLAALYGHTEITVSSSECSAAAQANGSSGIPHFPGSRSRGRVCYKRFLLQPPQQCAGRLGQHRWSLSTASSGHVLATRRCPASVPAIPEHGQSYRQERLHTVTPGRRCPCHATNTCVYEPSTRCIDRRRISHRASGCPRGQCQRSRPAGQYLSPLCDGMGKSQGCKSPHPGWRNTG